MKKLAFIGGILVGLLAAYGYFTRPTNLPPVQSGDLIFQTSTSSQSSAILMATVSPLTHMGIIRNEGGELVVLEAAGKVKATPLKEWVNRGLLKRVAIYRYSALTALQRKQIVAAAAAYHGKPYDIFFSFHNDGIYCSELPYLAYKSAGISIGRVQQISELNTDNALVKKLIKQRWERHPDCAGKQYNFEQCYDHILAQQLVTPASIAQDAQFKKIYSNYPFSMLIGAN